ncbi:MAG TPA: hypothetical protein VFV99_05775 [Kofleriaceae bacterium]|nr:hypothetical protein [Kofleriaceae bacterium]
MRALSFLLVLVPSLAVAGIERRTIERAGSGAFPDDADELVYRLDFTWQGQPTETSEISVRKSAIALNDQFRGDLRGMREGEVRRFSGHEIDGLTCDHFGCGPAKRFTARIELTKVIAHHDRLPDGMHIAAHPLRVVDATDSAELGGDDVASIREVRVVGTNVEIDVTYQPETRPGETRTMSIDELRARLADARAVLALRRGELRSARELLDHALALAPSLDEARAHRANVLLRTDGADAANEALTDLAARRPVWLLYRVSTDKLLAGLAGLPAVKALTTAGGNVEPSAFEERDLVVLAEPSGRYLGVYWTATYTDWVVRVIDRQSARVVESVSVMCSRGRIHRESLETCRAKSPGARVLAELGFAPTNTATMLGRYDAQVERIDDIEIIRTIGRELTVKRVVASPPATIPATNVALATTAAPATTSTSAATEPRRPHAWPLAGLAAVLLIIVAARVSISGHKHPR